MKTIQNISNSAVLYLFLQKIIGRKAKNAVSNLRKYRIETLSQLLGLVQRRIPRVSVKTARIKGITRAGLAAQRKIQPESIVSQLQNAMRVSRADALKVYNRCIRTSGNFQHYNFNSGWAFGSVKNRKTIKSEDKFWFSAPDINIEPGFFVAPNYNIIGPVFDQGERGTCVANAFCSCLDYLTGLKSSRQFFYHQAKMIDGIPDEEGTYIETAVRVFYDRTFTDLGIVEETIWTYNPYSGETPHQGPPPEKAFNTKRIFSEKDPVFIRETNKIEDIKYLLNCKITCRSNYSTDDKTHLVEMGAALHESFFSRNTSETGWVTMPLPGEAIVGYHAMVICGYDDERQLFLVRNSWGPQWAINNDRGFNGHAWFPYEYIEKFCHVGVSVGSFKMEHMIIPESERLYNNIPVNRYAGRVAAIGKERQKRVIKPRNLISFFGWLFKIVLVVILGYTFKDPIVQIKDKLIETIHEHLNINGLKNKVTDFFDDSTN